jgi:hypothetical protein
MKLKIVIWLLLLLVIVTLAGCSISKDVNFGPRSFNIGTGWGDFNLPSIKAQDRIDFNFTSAGAEVKYLVRDPNGNTVLVGYGGNKVQSGQGSFIGAVEGVYVIHFESGGILTSSVLTVSGTVHFNP